MNEFAGRAFQKGDELYINLGSAIQNSQVFMRTVPKQLAGRVDARAYNDLMTALEYKLQGKGVWCGPEQNGCAGICKSIGCVSAGIIFCPLACPIYSYHCCRAENAFCQVLTETVHEWKGRFGNGTALSWRKLGGGASQHDNEASVYAKNCPASCFVE